LDSCTAQAKSGQQYDTQHAPEVSLGAWIRYLQGHDADVVTELDDVEDARLALVQRILVEVIRQDRPDPASSDETATGTSTTRGDDARGERAFIGTLEFGNMSKAQTK
jgi:hypothetical protein